MNNREVNNKLKEIKTLYIEYIKDFDEEKGKIVKSKLDTLYYEFYKNLEVLTTKQLLTLLRLNLTLRVIPLHIFGIHFEA